MSSFDDGLRLLSVQMSEAMFSAKGIGLAAPQVNQSIRLMIVATGKEKYRVYINPEIIEKSQTTKVGEEGCLSIPNVYGNVERAKKIKVKYQDLNGQWHTDKASGLEAVVIQHEVDHLDGVLFIDRTNDIVQGAELLNNIK